MSLLCHNCGQDLQPSEQLPGRDGGVITPVLQSVVWKNEGEKEEWVLVPTETTLQIALCFDCLIPVAHKHGREEKLGLVYAAFDAEVAEARAKLSTKSLMVRFGSETDRELERLGKARSKTAKLVPWKECFLCGVPHKKFKNAPYLVYKVMDKAKCEGNLSGWGSYQWSNIVTGDTVFKICFSCLKSDFPRCYDEISNVLRGTGESNFSEVVRSELFVSPELMAAMKAHNSSAH